MRKAREKRFIDRSEDLKCSVAEGKGVLSATTASPPVKYWGEVLSSLEISGLMTGGITKRPRKIPVFF